MKYILKQIDDISGSNAVTTIEFNTDTLTGLLEHVELFIRGCGFFPPEGNLDYINDFEVEPNWDDCYYDGHEGMGSTLEDYPELKEQENIAEKHSVYYFDTERNK